MDGQGQDSTGNKKVTLNPGDVFLCPDCDLVIPKVAIEPGEKLCCCRCGCVLDAPVENSAEKTMALSLTGLLLFVPAIFFPLLTLDILGLESTGSIYASVKSLLVSGFVFTGFAVLLTSIVIPLLKLMLLCVVSAQVCMHRGNRITVAMFRLYNRLDEWGMLEVYMIGILVTIVKLFHMASITYDTGFFCFIGLLAATLLSSSMLDENYYWNVIHEACQKSTQSQTEAETLVTVPSDVVEESR